MQRILGAGGVVGRLKPEPKKHCQKNCPLTRAPKKHTAPKALTPPKVKGFWGVPCGSAESVRRSADGKTYDLRQGGIRFGLAALGFGSPQRWALRRGSAKRRRLAFDSGTYLVNLKMKSLWMCVCVLKKTCAYILMKTLWV